MRDGNIGVAVVLQLLAVAVRDDALFCYHDALLRLFNIPVMSLNALFSPNPNYCFSDRIVVVRMGSTGSKEKQMAEKSPSDEQQTRVTNSNHKTRPKIVIFAVDPQDTMSGSHTVNQKVQDEVTSSWYSSMAGGITRSLTYSIKSFGLSGKAFHRMMTKSAFMYIGKRSHYGAPSAPPLKDAHKLAWYQNNANVSKLSWSTRFSGKLYNLCLQFRLFLGGRRS